jgi:hypothetical protein
LALAAAACVSLLVPAGAQGTVTIGSKLTRPPTAGVGSCSTLCTMAQVSIASEYQASGGLVSPVNGTIISWSIRVGHTASPTSLRVIRRLGGGLSTGTGTSARVTPAVNSISNFATQLPIAIGETIGIDCCQPTTGASIYSAEGGASLERWFGPLTDGGPGRAPSTVFDWELLLNAAIEPTATFTIVKAKPKKGGKARVTVDLPNAGTLTAGDKSAQFAAAAGKGKKAKYLKRSSTQVTAPGRTVILVQPTKAARQALGVRGRLKAKLKLAFTPNGGSASTLIRKVKLKG